MWFFLAIATFICWGTADLFYKKGNQTEEKDSHYKTGMIVGIIMGIHATAYILITKPNIVLLDILKYLPVSCCYISSMIIGYKGLKYIDLSIASPIQNSSGVITSILLVLLFSISLKDFEWFGIFLIGIGVFILSLLENNKRKKTTFFFAILFPIIYALLDGAGTFLDYIYLDYQGIISEDMALIAYEYTFFLYSLFILLFQKRKYRKISIKEERNRIIAALLETAGQFFYVFAIASNSVLVAPIVASYSILSIILSRIFLNEKLSRQQYITIIIIFIGIIILGA